MVVLALFIGRVEISEVTYPALVKSIGILFLGALPILKELSRDVHSMVRRAALFSMATLYPDEGENLLIEAMTDPDPELRKWAKMTLENLLTAPSNAKTTFLTTRG